MVILQDKPFQAYFTGALPLYYASLPAVQHINKKAFIYPGRFKNSNV